MKKVKDPMFVEHFEKSPNIGSQTAQDLKLIGISSSKKLNFFYVKKPKPIIILYT
jgi:hypothetical protein